MDSNTQANFKYDIVAVSQELRIRPQILHKLLESFSQTLTGKIVELNTLVPQRNIEQIRAIMHEVKGTSGNLRLKEIYESADIMHMAVKAEEEQSKVLVYFETFKKKSDLFIRQYQSQPKGE
jgi:hypothetical protein